MPAAMSNFRGFLSRKKWPGAMLLKPTGDRVELPGFILEIAKR